MQTALYIFFYFYQCVFFFRTPKRKKRSPTPKPTKVHVGHLTRNVTKEHLQEIFSLYGTIKNVELQVDRIHTHVNRGHVYIEFETHEEAMKAIKFMNGGQYNFVLIKSIYFELIIDSESTFQDAHLHSSFNALALSTKSYRF